MERKKSSFEEIHRTALAIVHTGRSRCRFVKNEKSWLLSHLSAPRQSLCEVFAALSVWKSSDIRKTPQGGAVGGRTKCTTSPAPLTLNVSFTCGHILSLTLTACCQANKCKVAPSSSFCISFPHFCGLLHGNVNDSDSTCISCLGLFVDSQVFFGN